LTELHLASNQIAQTGGLALVRSLGVNSTLRTLSLEGNTINGNCVEELALQLKSNTTLTFLALTGNNITNIQPLLSTLAFANFSLCDLRIGFHSDTALAPYLTRNAHQNKMRTSTLFALLLPFLTGHSSPAASPAASPYHVERRVASPSSS
jgi:Leucine-rich repeat (LRR) protein